MKFRMFEWTSFKGMRWSKSGRWEYKFGGNQPAQPDAAAGGDAAAETKPERPDGQS
jgi:hypothetical protein